MKYTKLLITYLCSVASTGCGRYLRTDWWTFFRDRAFFYYFNVLYRWPHTYWITIFVKITASRKKPPVQTVKTDCRWWPEECWEHLSLHTQGWSSELQHCCMMTTGFFLNYITYVICNSVNIWAVRAATSWGWHCHECFSHLFFVWMSCMG